MLQAIRDRATGWIAYGIVGFLVIPFAFWGIDQYQGGGQIYVAEVDGVEITLQEYQRALQEQQSRLQAMFGNQLDPGFFDQDQLKQDVLRRLIDQRLLASVSAREGYRVGDREIVDTLREIPAFQTDGVFDGERYRNALQRQGMGPAEFEAQLRVDLSTSQLQGGVQASAFLTEADVDAVIRVRDQSREVAYATLSFEAFEDQVVIDSAETEDWFEQNRAGFEAPERLRVEYLELDASSLGGDVDIDEADILAFYDQQADRFVTEEERTASHVFAPIPVGASSEESAAALALMQEIHGALADGSRSFEDIMAATAEDPDSGLESGSLGLVVEGMLDPGLESAIFALEQIGDYSEPVRSDFGYHIVRLDDLVPGSKQPFDEVEEQLREELQANQGESLFFEQVETLANLSFESADSLEPAAEAVELEVKSSDWFDRYSGSGIAEDPRVREVAFADDVLLEGLNSEIIELSPTRALVLRILEHEEARSRELEEVREEVEAALRRERAGDAIAAAAASVLKSLDQGATLRTLADERGAEWNAPQMITRTQSDIPRALIEEVFRLPRPSGGGSSFGLVVMESGDRALLEMTQVIDADPSATDQDSKDTLSGSLRQQAGAAEFDAVLESLRSRTDIRLYPENL